LSVIFFSIAILRKWLSGLSNLEFRLGDVYKQNFSEADVIYTFAMIGSVNGRLKDKILEEIKLESKLISYVFSIKKWQGQTLIDDTGEFGNKIHVYIKNKKIN